MMTRLNNEPGKDYPKAQGQGVFELMIGSVIFLLMAAVLASVSLYLLVEHAAVSGVREGARLASLSADVNAAKSQIVTRVQQVILATCGQNIPATSITVTPPDPSGQQGSRQVTVSLEYDLPTPINADGILSAFGAGGVNTNPQELATVPIVAKAVMRYEE